MDKGYEKEGFKNLSIKASVVKQFRKFCREYGKSQSMTLLDMLSFFRTNEISPSERFGETISSLKFQMKKRFNALIAIIKTIEKQQTEPTAYLIKRLFEVEAEQESDDSMSFLPQELISEHEEVEYYKNQSKHYQVQYADLKQDTELILEKLKYVRTNFGSGYYRVNLSKDEIERIKNKLNDVHNNNTPETR